MVHGSGMAAIALRFSAFVDICVFCSLLLSKGCKEVGEIYWYTCTLVINQPNLYISLFLLSGSVSPTCISSPALIWWVHFEISPSLFNQKHSVISSELINVYNKILRNELGLPSNTHSSAGRALCRVLHHSRPGVLDRWVLQDHLSLSKKSLTPSTFPFSKSRTSPFLSQMLFFWFRAVSSRHRSRGSIQVLNCGHFRAWHVCPNKQCQVNPIMISPCITTFLVPSTAQSSSELDSVMLVVMLAGFCHFNG